jgi:membrane protein required for colicin V production
MTFTMLDGILAVVVLISAVLAMIRGFTREVFSIASWIAAAAAAYFLWGDVKPYVQNYIEDENLALGVTIAGIFFITLLVVSIITMRISDFVLDSKAGPLDRTLGFLFGAARGILLVIIAVLFLNFFIAPDRQPQWIAEAQTKPWLDSLGQDLMNKLPDDPESQILERIRGITHAGQDTPPADADNAAPAPDEAPDPGISPDDQNQLQRQIGSPPAN